MNISDCYAVEIFVSARVGLATLGRVRIALDLGLLSTLVYFCSLLACKTLEGGKLHPGVTLVIWPSSVPEWR